VDEDVDVLSSEYVTRSGRTLKMRQMYDYIYLAAEETVEEPETLRRL
jgi:hypothetical protein